MFGHTNGVDNQPPLIPGQPIGDNTPQAMNDLLQHVLRDRPINALHQESFAALHGDASLAGTAVLGGIEQFQASLQWWIDTLDSLAWGSYYRLKILRAEDPQLALSWKKDLEQMSSALPLLMNGQNAQLKKLITDELKKEKRFILPIPFKDSKTGLFHVSGCVFEHCEDGIVRIRLIDKGIVAEAAFTTLKIEGGKTKKSYTDLPMRLRDPKLLESDNLLGDTLFTKLSALAQGTTHASPTLIFGLFHDVVGEVHPIDIVQPELTLGDGWYVKTRNMDLWLSPDMAVSPARAETSMHQISRLAIRDQITRGRSPAKIDGFKRLTLAVKIQSFLDLIRPLRYYPQDGISVPVIQRCLQDFNTSVRKGFDRKLLNEQELFFCRALSDEVSALLKQRSPAPALPVPPAAALPTLGEEALRIQAKLPPPPSTAIAAQNTDQPPLLFRHPPITPSNIKGTLETLCVFARLNPAAYRFQTINSLFSKLPLDPAFWNEVPAADIKDALKYLKNAVQVISQGDLNEKSLTPLFPELRLLAATGLVISDCLARRLTGADDLKLQDFALHLPSLEDTYYFQNVESEIRWKAILEYVNTLSVGKPRSLTFAPDVMTPSDWQEISENTADLRSYKLIKQRILFERQFRPINRLEDLAGVVEKRTLTYTNGNKREEATIVRNEANPHSQALQDCAYFHTLTAAFFRKDPELSKLGMKNLIACEKQPKVIHHTIHSKDANTELYYIQEGDINPERGLKEQEPLPLTLQRSTLKGETASTIKPKESENELVVAQSTHYQREDEISLEELKKISREPRLQLSMLMQYCRRHADSVERVDIQSFVEYILLRNGSSIDQLRNNPLLQQELLTFLREQIEASSIKLGNLNRCLFWSRINLHVLERLQKYELIDSFLDQCVANFETSFRLVQEQMAGKDQGYFQTTGYMLATHLAYFQTRYRTLTPRVAEKFVGWQSVRTILKCENPRIPYWINLDVDQYLVDRGDQLLPLLGSMKGLPSPFKVFTHSSFFALGDAPVMQILGLGVCRFQGQGHNLDINLFSKTITFDGKPVSFAKFNQFDFPKAQQEAINKWYFQKKWKASAEQMLGKWFRKPVTVSQVNNQADNTYKLVTSEGTLILDTNIPCIYVDKPYHDPIKRLIHPTGAFKLTEEETQLWVKKHTPKFSLIMIEQGIYEIEDGSARFIYTQTSFEVQERIQIGDKKGWYRRLDMPPELPANFSHGTLWMRSSDSLNSLPQYVIQTREGIVAELETLNPEQMRIRRLNTNGTRTEEVLVNASAHPEIPFLKRFRLEQSLNIWATKGVITRVECTELNNLTFLYDGKQWTCQQMPGWVVDEQEQPSNLGKIHHGIVLKNGAEKRLLMPTKALKPSSWVDNKCDIEPMPIGGSQSHEAFVTYQQDPLSLDWVGTTDTASIYLAYLMMAQGMEEAARKAVIHLELKASWTPQQWDILALIAKTPNFTPEATALKMRMALWTIQNDRQPRFGATTSNYRGAVQASFWETIALEMPRFLNLQGETHSHIPARFQLKEEDISSILNAIESFERNDGGPNPKKPSMTLLESTHYRFHPHPEAIAHNPSALFSEGGLEPWWVNHHFWEEISKGKSYEANRYSYYERRTLIPASLWQAVEHTISKEISSNGSACNGLGPIPDHSLKPAKPLDKEVSYSYKQVRENFWPLMTQIYHLSKDSNLKSDAVQNIDVELYCIYRSLLEQGLKDVKAATDNYPTNWSRAMALLCVLMSARAQGPQFAKNLSKGGYSPANWHALLFQNMASSPIGTLNKAVEELPNKNYKPSTARDIPATSVVPKLKIDPAVVPSKVLPKSSTPKPVGPEPKQSKYEPVRPLERILKDHFDGQNLPVYPENKRKFVIDPAQEKTLSEGGKRRAQELKTAFEKVDENGVSVATSRFERYQLNKTTTEPALKASLNKALRECDTRQLEARIVDLANYPTKAERARLPLSKQLEAELRDQDIAAGKIQPLSLLDTLLLFDPQRPAILQRENPSLTPEKLDELHKACLEYIQIQTTKAQLTEAISFLNNTPEGLESCSEVLAKKQTFDLQQNWVLALYQAMSGQLLRSEPDQAKLIQEIVAELFKEGPARDPARLKQVFFEFQAGQGKTKLLAVLIAAYIRRQGKTPVFVSLPQLFDITKEDLSSSMWGFLRMTAQPISLKLDQNPTLQELCNLRDALKSPSEKTLCLVITPETYHTLWLEYQLALIYGENDRVRVLDQILCFFEDEAIDFVDEGHRNASSLLEANMAFGVGESMPEYAIKLHLDVIRSLVTDPSLSGIVKLRTREQTRVTPEQMKALKRELASRFGAKICDMPAINDKLIDYLVDIKKDPEDYLVKWNNSSHSTEVLWAKKLAALRGMLEKILPHALSIVEDREHGPSVDPTNEVEAPLDMRDPTQAKYEDPELSLTLTIKGFLQRGFKEASQMRNLVTRMQEKMEEEKLKLLPGETLTPSENEFFEWQKGSTTKYSLADLVPDSTPPVIFEELLKTFANHTDVLFKYLELKPLNEVLVFPLKVKSTATRLAYGFHSNIFCSATLGPKEKYPFYADPAHYKQDLPFLAKVIQRGSFSPNDRFVWYPSDDIDSFLQHLPQDDLRSGRLTGLINFGGASPGKSNSDWAKKGFAYFEKNNLPFDGVIYVHQEGKVGSKTDAPKEKLLYLLTRDDPNPVPIKGSQLKQELKRLGKDHLKLFKIYGPDDTTGLDLAIEPNGLTAVTFGEDPNTDEFAQALLRMRLYLKAMQQQELGQGHIWCIPEGLKTKLSQILGKPAAEITPKDCFVWSLENYHQKLLTYITAAAYQELEGLFVEIARREMRGRPPEEQIKQMREKYLHGFAKKMGYDPFAKHGYSNAPRPTGVVLGEFVQECTRLYQISLNSHPWAMERRDYILKQTEAFVSEIAALREGPLGSLAHQRQRTHEHQRTRTHQYTHTQHITRTGKQSQNWKSRKEGDYADKEVSLMQPAITTADAFIRSAKGHFKLGSIPEQLFLTVDALHATEADAKDLWTVRGLKDVDHLLVIQDDKAEPIFVVVSQENAKSYLQQMEKGQVLPGRKVALIGKDGTVAENGSGNYGFTDQWLLGLKQQPGFQQISAWLGLMCGQVTQKEALKGLMNRHEADVVNLFKLVQDNQVLPSDREHKRFHLLLQECRDPLKKTYVPPVNRQSLEYYIEVERKRRPLEKAPVTPPSPFPQQKDWQTGKFVNPKINPVRGPAPVAAPVPTPVKVRAPSPVAAPLPAPAPLAPPAYYPTPAPIYTTVQAPASVYTSAPPPSLAPTPAPASAHIPATAPAYTQAPAATPLTTPVYKPSSKSTPAPAPAPAPVYTQAPAATPVAKTPPKKFPVVEVMLIGSSAIVLITTIGLACLHFIPNSISIKSASFYQTLLGRGLLIGAGSITAVLTIGTLTFFVVKKKRQAAEKSTES